MTDFSFCVFADEDGVVSIFMVVVRGEGLYSPSLHPSAVIRETYKDISLNNVATTTLPLTDLLVYADIYIAHMSTTFKWSLALGIETVLFDCYHFLDCEKFPVSADCKKLTIIREYRELMNKLSEFERSFSEIGCKNKRKKRNAYPYYGIIDGNVINRMTNKYISYLM